MFSKFIVALPNCLEQTHNVENTAMFYFIILKRECLKSKLLFVLKFPLIHLKSKAALKIFLNLEWFVQCKTLFFDSPKWFADKQTIKTKTTTTKKTKKTPKTGKVIQKVLIYLAIVRNDFCILKIKSVLLTHISIKHPSKV